jgi:hypothetical protein
MLIGQLIRMVSRILEGPAGSQTPAQACTPDRPCPGESYLYRRHGFLDASKEMAAIALLAARAATGV